MQIKSTSVSTTTCLRRSQLLAIAFNENWFNLDIDHIQVFSHQNCWSSEWMFLRRRWFASRPGVSLPGTHKKASTRGRSSSNWSQNKKLAGFSNVLVSKILCQGTCLVRWWLTLRWTSTSRSRETFWKYLRSTNGQIHNLIPNYTYAHQKENVWFVQLFGQTISGVKLFHGCNPGLLKVPRIFKADKTYHRVIRTPEQLTHILSEKFFFFSLDYDHASLKAS